MKALVREPLVFNPCIKPWITFSYAQAWTFAATCPQFSASAQRLRTQGLTGPMSLITNNKLGLSPDLLVA